MTQPEAPKPLASVEPWDLVSEGYAAEATLVMKAYSLRALELLEPSASERALDVACGPGTLTLELCARVAQVDALDFSPRMLGLLDAQLAARGITNVKTHVGDGQALPFADDGYELAASIFGLMFFPDRPRGYAELFRALRSGGRALVSSWAPVEDSTLMTLMFGAIRCVSPEWPAPRRDPLGLENPEVLAAEMRQAGFTAVRVEPHTHSVEPGSASDLWSALCRSSAPLVLLRKRLGEEEWARRAPTALDYVEQSLASAPSQLSTTAWLALGVKPG